MLRSKTVKKVLDEEGSLTAVREELSAKMDKVEKFIKKCLKIIRAILESGAVVTILRYVLFPT
jgi:hypothetical protein